MLLILVKKFVTLNLSLSAIWRINKRQGDASVDPGSQELSKQCHLIKPKGRRTQVCLHLSPSLPPRVLLLLFSLGLLSHLLLSSVSCCCLVPSPFACQARRAWKRRRGLGAGPRSNKPADPARFGQQAGDQPLLAQGLLVIRRDDVE